MSRIAPPRSRTTAPCTLPRIAVAAVPGRSEYGNTWMCVSGERSRYARQLLEVLIGLAGKADDDVRADRRVRHASRGCRRRAPRSSRSCTAGASRPARVARVLQRQMKVRREALGRGDEIDDLARAVHRLERADAEEHVAIAVRCSRSRYGSTIGSQSSARSRSMNDDAARGRGRTSRDARRSARSP